MEKRIQITTASTAETLALGKKIGKLIDTPLVIALTGDLGSGKTVLVQGIAQGLGVPPEYPVTSPTYTLINEYDGKRRLFHVDLYRLAGLVDTYDLGLDDILAGNGVTAIEWAERLEGEDFSSDVTIELQTAGESRRILTLFFYGPKTENLIDGMKHM